MITNAATSLLILLVLAITASAQPNIGNPPARLVDPIVGHLDGTIVALVQDDAPGPVIVTLEDGRQLPTTAIPITLAQQQQQQPAPWLVPAIWSLAQPEVRPDRVYLIIQAPLDAVGQGLTINDRYHEVVWLTPPTDARALASPLTPIALASETFRDLLAPLESSPIEHWRYRLATGDLVRPNPRPLTLTDPIELLGSSIERQWIAALGRLHDADPALASRTRSAVITDIRFGESRPVPLSLATPQAEAQLLRDLLNPALTPDQIIDRATLWLATTPSSKSWIVDAAGPPRDADNHPVLSIGIANLREQPLTIRINRPGDDPSLERRDIPARTAVGELARSVVPPPPDTRIAVRPPGADLTAFHPTFTSQTWLSAITQSTNTQLTARLDRAPTQPNQPTRWRLYLERPSTQPDEPFRIHLHQGPSARNQTTTITHTGNVIAPSNTASQLVVKVLPQDNNTWRALITIPDQWINNKQLQLGVELEDARANRWTWPRPILPWQTVRPRAMFDLSAWDQLPPAQPRDPFSR